ncbi:hotdog fold thioesterase [Spongiibacter sp. KMU-158]|uniref:Hotdog fold thioesterase n=1 Tax=Spongiibacter pelagi TaxID=2760804 RepID=A0A927GVR6_9GAMM|nr:hotdog domain-containing protein [Spongiibacter pelagi]MBD2858946.1 hotdog fold thioesterase [Spongiibacter pelagi]
MSVELDEVSKFSRCMVDEDTEFHFSLLGLKVIDVDRCKASMKMPYSDIIVGDPETGVIHGGPITALLDTCCGFSAASAQTHLAMTPTIDLRIDYMTSAKPGIDVIAEAEVYRNTEHVIFTRAIAHQGDRERPVAFATGTFFNLPPETFEDLRQAFDSGVLSSLRDSVQTQPEAPAELGDSEIDAQINRVPYARTLGIRALPEEGCFVLPPKRTNIGNFTLPSLHGGAISGFMELSALVAVLQKTGMESIPKVIDISVDYLRAGRFQETFSRCTINYLGRRMINVSVVAWQDDESKPIATSRVQFLVKESE